MRHWKKQINISPLVITAPTLSVIILGELRYLFVYYCDISPQDVTEDMIMEYLVYLAKTLGCSRVKCKMAAQSISFFAAMC
ncbi:MAG: hypothetical protein WKG06_18505 [Segetibacter sp.]